MGTAARPKSGAHGNGSMTGPPSPPTRLSYRPDGKHRLLVCCESEPSDGKMGRCAGRRSTAASPPQSPDLPPPLRPTPPAWRWDFGALQHRLHGGSERCVATQVPACLVVFDVLALGVDDLCGLPYAQRRDLAVDLLADAAPPLALMPMTTSQPGARAWLTNHTARRCRRGGGQASDARLPTGAAERIGWPNGSCRRAWSRRRAAPPGRPGHRPEASWAGEATTPVYQRAGLGLPHLSTPPSVGSGLEEAEWPSAPS
jgi:hypothetical protein